MNGDAATESTSSRLLLKSSPAITSGNGESSNAATANLDELQKIRDIMSRYVGQLLHGCGDSTCTETLCETGRQNTTRRPLRKHTPRSARAIALTLVSGPKPRSRLCLRYEHDRTSPREFPAERPRDPKSFVQHLSDTSIMRILCSPTSEAEQMTDLFSDMTIPGFSNHDDGFITWNRKLDELSKAFQLSNSPGTEDLLIANQKIASELYDCIQFILSTFPTANRAQWLYVNNMVSAGSSYPAKNESIPADDSHNTWLRILHGLDHGAALQLLCRLVRIIAYRTGIEKAAYTGNGNGSDFRDSVRIEPGTLSSWLAAHLVHGYHKQPDDNMSIVVCLKRSFLHHWEGETNLVEGSMALAILEFMNCVYERFHSVLRDDSLDAMFQLPVVASQVDMVDIASTFKRGSAGTTDLLTFHWLFSKFQLVAYFRTICHLRMREAHSDAEKASNMRSRSGVEFRNLPQGPLDPFEDHYLLLSVSRGDVLQDAFDQLWQRRSSELLRPLRVRLGEMDVLEVGHDLGGVQIEFFNLVCKELFSEDRQMFTTDPSTGLSFFRSGSLQPLHMFELCGLLFGLAMHNGITLPVNLPWVFYMKLKQGKPEIQLHDIADGWPVMRKSLMSILLEDVPGLENGWSFEANGLRLTVLVQEQLEQDKSGRYILPVVDATPIVHHDSPYNFACDSGSESDSETAKPRSPTVEIENIADAWPGWHLVDATERPSELVDQPGKNKYINEYVEWLAVNSVKPQWDAFTKGFTSIIDLDSVFTTTIFRDILEGDSHLDINELRRSTQYDGYERKSTYIKSFWRLVASWAEDKQKQLLKFVTACERIPAGGASNITFKIQRGEPESLEHLPLSQTCFGTLVLPEYESLEMLDRKLSLAIMYGLEGFGQS